MSVLQKNTTKKLKKQVEDWEKVFTIHVSDKERVSRTCL